jgi:hypothetical protein
VDGTRRRTVGELVAAAGGTMADVAEPYGMGLVFAPALGLTARYAWDDHHEAPVGSLKELARRELVAEAPAPAAPDARAVSARRLAELVERLRAGAEPGAPELVLDPPLPAAEVAAILGAPDAFARTVDVHMSSWRLATADGPVEIGRWSVDAALDRRPSGDLVPGVEIPAASARLLGGGESVGRLRFAPRPEGRGASASGG